MRAKLQTVLRAVEVLGIAAVVYLAANALGAVAAVSVMEPKERKLAVQAAAQQIQPPTAKARAAKGASGSGDKLANRRHLAESIAEANVFCPSCTDEPPPPPDQQGPQLITDKQGRPLGSMLVPGEPKSSLPLELVATMESTDPAASLATIRHEEQSRVAVYGTGDRIREGVMVAAVGRGLVHLRNGQQFEYLPLREQKKRSRKKRGRKKKKRKRRRKRRRKRKYVISGAEDAIECSSKTSCTIDREFVEKVLAKPALLAKQAKVRPRAKNGQMRGFKLYRVRRKSLPRLLKLRSGDLLTDVNGHALDSMDSAMKLYRQLRHASHLTVQVKRRGKTLEMNYDIN